jgi:hypothetical protein
MKPYVSNPATQTPGYLHETPHRKRPEIRPSEKITDAKAFKLPISFSAHFPELTNIYKV